MDILLVLAVLPAILLFVLVYKNDTGHRESPGMIAKMFAFGCLSAFVAGAIETVGSTLIDAVGLDRYGTIIYDLVMYIIVVALAEELAKFLFLLTTIDDNRFNYTFDGMTYAVAIGLGFATLENIMYVLGTWSAYTAIVRGVLSVPLHCTCAVFMGYFFGYARRCFVENDHAGAFGYALLSLAIPVAIHGFYDFAIENEITWIAAAGLLFTITAFVLAFLHLRKASRANVLLSAEEPPFTRF